MKKIFVTAVVGPTASGKTALSVELCKVLSGEVVSADSMQIYRHMDIATAKPTEEEKQGIEHPLMDFLEPSERFSVAAYCDLAKKEIEDIAVRGKLPVIVGGTGLYVDSLLNNVSFAELDFDDDVREELRQECEEKGVDALLDQVREFDPESYERLKEGRNPKRIIRCIEVYRLTGKTQTQLNREALLSASPYKAVKIGLKSDDRQYLYDRINLRVDQMLDLGLLEEAQRYYQENIGQTALAAIGYKELKPYLDNEKSLDECVESLKQATRRYAKRQLTWFMRDPAIHWFDIDQQSFDEILGSSLALIKENSYGE